ncbi:MAG: hypothetical protein HY318_01770 [Armatimonadetes bacterium]|nr:hypothetical protein [Armatimonadota bacterium]
MKMGAMKASGLVLLLCAAPSLLKAATVKVDVTCSVDIGGTQIKPTLFGITAFEGFPSVVWDADFRAKIEACRFGAVRFPATLSWCSPDKDDLSWYQSEAARATFCSRPLFGDRYMYGRFLPVVRALGAEPIPCLLSPPQWMLEGSPIGLPKDWDLWGNHCAEYLKLWREHDPQLKYFQVWNEPNANFWKDEAACAAHGGYGGLYGDFFNSTARAVKAVHPDLKSLGPVLCWPPAWPPAQEGKKPWYTWEEFTLPYLERTKDSGDSFDYHAYDVEPGDFVVQTSLVYAQSLKQRPGRPLLSWITESNYALNCEPSDWDDLQAEWQRRALPYERFLLTLIDHQDMVEGNLYHDLQGMGRWCLFNRKGQETGAYGVFWILRNLRGRRVLAECDDLAVRLAASAEPERLTVLAFNDSDQVKPLEIHGAKPNGQYCTFNGAQVLLPPAAKGQCPSRVPLPADWKVEADSFTISAELPPFATGAFYVYPIPAFGQQRVVTVRQYFGDALLQFLQGHDATVKINLVLPTGALAEGAKVSLRIGLMSPKPDESYRIRVNAVERSLSATALQEVSAEGLLHPGKNDLEIAVHGKDPNPARALGFVSAVVAK